MSVPHAPCLNASHGALETTSKSVSQYHKNTSCEPATFTQSQEGGAECLSPSSSASLATRNVAPKPGAHLYRHERLTHSPEGNLTPYWQCIMAMTGLWTDSYNPSRRAYELTLTRLRQALDRGVVPFWGLLRELGRVPKARTGRGKDGVPRWYHKRAVIRLLVRAAKLDRAGTLVRYSAVVALGKLKATHQLQRLWGFFVVGRGKAFEDS